MVFVAGILATWLALASCCCAATTEAERPRPQSSCDEARLTAGMRECDAKFDPSSVSGLDLSVKTVCSAVREYKACLAELIRVHGCGDTPLLVSRQQRINEFLREQRICVEHVNVSSQVVMRPLLARPGACAMQKAWNAQFLCAKSFHAEVDEIEGQRGAQSKEICGCVKRYYSCLDAAVHNGPCKNDADLGRQARYFRNVLTHKYSDLCPEQLGLPPLKPKVKVLRAMGAASGSLAAQSCQEDKATKEFFACGLLFNVIVSRNPPKERICTAYKNMEKCTRDLQCATATATFNVHSMRVMDVLLSPYDKYCRGFVGIDVTNRTVPPPPPPPPPPTCNEDLYLQKYFECGLMYMFNLPGANETDYNKRTSLVCDLIHAHKACVDSIRTTSYCPNGIPIQKNLDYFDNELRMASKEKCSALAAKRAARRRFRSSVPRCHIREYAGTYFTCGTIFLAATYPDAPPLDELCRLLAEFMKCVAGLVPCRTNSDITMQLDYFTSVLTEGHTENCKHKNISGFCDKFILMKDYFACSLTYYQSYDEFGRSYLLTKQHSCKLLEDYGKCTYEKVLKNSCQALKVLFSNIREVRDYMAKRFNQRNHVSCSIPSGMQKVQKQRGPVSALQSSCDEFGAVKRLLLCGVAFHRMLPVPALAQNSSSSSALVEVDNMTTEAVCPLVKEMKFCVYSAVKDSGCSESLFFNTEVSLLRRRLLAEFEGDCDDIFLSSGNSSGPAKNREGCELKEFTQDWETCEADRAREVALKYRSGTGSSGTVIIDVRQRDRFCRDLYGYLQCLRDSAGRHHCPALAPGNPRSDNQEWFRRLGFLACSSSPCLPFVSRWALRLFTFAGTACAVARYFAGWP